MSLGPDLNPRPTRPRLGLFGGTFDPVHSGHWQLATAALSLGGLAQVLWIPSQIPPHKSSCVTPLRQRRAMLERAIAAEPRFILPALPLLDQPSYAIALWQFLQAQMPPATWVWIVGIDTFQTLPRWYRRCELMQHCQWLVAPRSPAYPYAVAVKLCAAIATNLQIQCGFSPHWQLLEVELPAVASHQLRQAYQQQPRQPPAGIMPAVHDYITQHCLYR